MTPEQEEDNNKEMRRISIMFWLALILFFGMIGLIIWGLYLII